MRYLLDTNVCVAFLNGRSPSVEQRLMKEARAGSDLLVSSVAAFELWYGVEKSRRKEENAGRLEAFFAEFVTLLPFDGEDSRVAGKVRVALEAIGRPIGEYDLLIAGQALRHNLTFVTANAREFSRVRNLSWQDWSE